MRKFLLLLVAMVSLSVLQAQVNEADAVAAKQLIAKNAGAIGLTAKDQQNSLISSTYVSPDGLRMVYLQQSYLGIPVYNQMQVLAFMGDKLVSNAGGRLPSLDKLLPNASGFPNVSAVSAVNTALADAKVTPLELAIPIYNSTDGHKFEFGRLGATTENIKAELLWYPVEGKNDIRLVWQVFVTPINSSDYWLIRVDANTNAVVDRTNLTITCQWDKENHSIEEHIAKKHGEVAANRFNMVEARKEDTRKFEYRPFLINTATYRVVKYPAESPQHPGGTPSLHTDPWTQAPGNATSLKWNSDPTDYNITRGNNVYAQEDRDNNNNTFGTPGNSTTAIPNLTFDYAYDFTKSPTDVTSVNQQAAIVNVFYWNNIIHDISYTYGFDEVSGNFQNDNQGRGGLGADYVIADAQDAGGTNNANFATPSDGSRPRMQMYLWTTATPTRDGDLDASVVVHEYTHGISNRFTGGPANSSCLSNAEQGGEGWSDYFALMSTTNWATATVNDGPLRRGIGTYVLNQPTNGTGIRRFPYSTDIAVYPLTYANMPTSVVPHGTGEIWCEMLWEMTWGIIQQDNAINPNLFNPGPTASMIGNSAALKLVTEGMRLQPCNPGYVDARNAILKADTLLFNKKYSCTIWKAFAKRGLGRNASQGSANSVTDGVADFSVDAGNLKLNGSPIAVQEGQNITYTNTVTAGDCSAITNFSVTDTLPTNVTYVSGGSYNAGNRVVTFAPVTLSAGQTQTYQFVVTVNNGTYFAPTQPLNETVPTSSLPATWTANPATGTAWGVSSVQSHSSPNAFFAPDATVATDIRLSTNTAYTLNPGTVSNYSTLSFWHSYNSEDGWDGGVVEISTDNGTTWNDLGSKMISGKYNGSLGTGSNNPIAGRAAFTGNSGGFIQTIANLSSYAGQGVMIRFRFASDDNTAPAGGGWFVDDVQINSTPAVQMRSSIFNASGVRQSFSDTLTNILLGCTATTLTAQPANVNSCAGNTVTYTVGASGTGITYQWQVNTGSGFVNIPNGAPYSNVTTPTLTITGITAGMSGYIYRCVVSSTCAAATNSNPATLTVGTTASISSQPVNSTVCTGVNTSFSITATGATSYQWQVNTGSGFVDLTNVAPYSGVTTSTLTITNPTAAISGYQYRCVLGSCGSPVNSNAATLTITVPVSITANPASVVICQNATNTFSVTTTGTVSSYQWQFSTDGGVTWVNLSGATTSTYVLSGAMVGQNGYRFRCVVTGSCGPVNSAAAILTVNPLPDFTLGTIPSVVCLSDTAIYLSASVTGGTWSGPGVQDTRFIPGNAGLGLKTVSYTVTAAGCSTTRTAQILVNDCGERHLLLDAFSAVFVYPNPNTGKFSIRLNTDLYHRIGLKVFASDGKLIKTQQFAGVGYGSVMNVDISNMPAGVYQLYIYNDEGEFIKKAISIIVYRQ